MVIHFSFSLFISNLHYSINIVIHSSYVLEYYVKHSEVGSLKSKVASGFSYLSNQGSSSNILGLVDENRMVLLSDDTFVCVWIALYHSVSVLQNCNFSSIFIHTTLALCTGSTFQQLPLCVNVDFFFAIELKSRFLHVMVGNRSAIDMEFTEIMIYSKIITFNLHFQYSGHSSLLRKR